MKLKRLGALCLSLALTLSLTTLPAGAAAPGEESSAAFTDIEDHWARAYIEDMAQKGYAKGEGEKFYPDRTMSALETILFCSRVTNVDEATQEHIYVDHRDEVAALLPESVLSWASAEATIGEVAVAMEAGVVSLDELEALNQIAPGSLDYAGGPQPSFLWNISREDVFVYLVRAMQLEPLAKSVSPEVCAAFLRSYYADVDEISPSLQPYIYVLTYYKIVEGSPNGDGKNLIRPKDSIRRAEMMKIVSIALNVMDTLDIHTELSEYTDYDWASGIIDTVATELTGDILLTLKSEVSGSRTYRLPPDVRLYENNMLVQAKDNLTYLNSGKYIRLNFTADGQVDSARLGGSVTAYEGAVSLLDGNELVLTSDGLTRSFTINRFTEVLAGGEAGDRAVIDPEAGYTGAVCYVDTMGRLIALKLTGGTIKVTGLLQGIKTASDGSATVTLNAFDGISTDYAVPAAAPILVNGVQGILAPAYVGRFVTLRVTEEDSRVASVSVDTLTTYIQGRILRQGAIGGVKSLVIANALDFNSETTCNVDSGAFITYGGEDRTVAQIENGWFVTARLVNGVIVEMTGYPSNTMIEGVLSSIQFGATTVLILTLPDGGATTYELDVNDLPEITRDGKKATIDQLRSGDTLTLTLRYNEIQKIEATPQEANLTGIVQAVSSSKTGNQLTVLLSDGTEQTYDVGLGVSVTQGGAAATFRDLNVDDTVALVVSGGELLSISITAAATVEGQLIGEVFTVTNIGNTRAITLLVEGRTDPITVDLRTKSAVIQDRTGAALSISKLAAGDKVVVFGAYDGAVFVATLVTKI